MKIVVACVVIIIALTFGIMSFVESNVEYTDIQTAISTSRKVQVKGSWVRDQKTEFDVERGQFSFVIKDDSGEEVRVVYDGARPNNFELAEAIVVKGRYADGYFHASDILTKCPSKYEGGPEEIKKSL